MTEPIEPRKVQWGMDEYLFTTQSNDISGIEKSSSGFGTIPSWLPTKPVSRPVNFGRYLRHRWWRGCWYVSHCSGRPSSRLHNWIVGQDSRASRLWYLAQVKYNATTVFKGFWGPPKDTP